MRVTILPYAIILTDQGPWAAVSMMAKRSIVN